MALIEVTNLIKSYDRLDVLKQISFTVERNEVVAIIGPSGSGKSTLLRSLVHLETIDNGTITVDGSSLVKNGVYAKPKEIKEITAKMGMVFQHFNLFPHLTVKQNLELAPKLVRKEASGDLEKEVAHCWKKSV